ncbi:MAG: trehalose-phosphatase [Candidatus Aegiribacteria sp.]|nr:trehalose-phosphatase [Candidatus Aegiribacteria sp.]MBD3295500.1 trehalose-phosphatase [Candidatus Fermentibacteria bacterium]
MRRKLEFDLDSLEAFILDMDGVVTRTASIHAKAWKRMFDQFLEECSGSACEPFHIESDYLEYVDGKPRYSGAKSFLESRGIELPMGKPEDSPGKKTVCGLGNLKNRYFHSILDTEGAAAIPATVDFVERGIQKGVKFGVISSSRNAMKILEAAGVTSLFETILGGREAQEMDIEGKPAPDIFLEAARRLEVEPDSAAVVEDSQAGVSGGKTGGFALVVGIDNGDQERELLDEGADIVVDNLMELWKMRTVKPEPVASLPEAMDEINRIMGRLRLGKPVLFLDYDGTLTPIVKRPEDAVLPERTGKLLKELSEKMPVTILSGRDLQDVKAMVDIEGLVYAGSHGFDVFGAEVQLPEEVDADELTEQLDSAEEQLTPEVNDIQGARVERKKYAIALHYRETPDEEVEFLREISEKLADDHSMLKMTPGKKIFELRPDVDWDKGRALTALLNGMEENPSAAIPIYIGDDTTDEDAFREIRDSGIGILVNDSGEGVSHAAFHLRDPEEVAGFLEKLLDFARQNHPEGEWKFRYTDFSPSSEQLRETLCATGNGYMVTRGAAPESSAGENHYPGTYIGGCYNRRVSHVSGKDIENESIVNMPNWLPLTFRIEGDDWFLPEDVELHSYQQVLDMAGGILNRKLVCSDDEGRTTRLSQRRFAHMGRRHLAGLSTEIVPENWSGSLTVKTALDGNVYNAQVKRYQQLDNHHLQPVDQGTDGRQIIWLQVETNQSHIRVGLAARTCIFLNGVRISPKRDNSVRDGYTRQEITVELEEGDELRIEKIAAYYTSRDHGISECLLEARNDVFKAPGFDELMFEHVMGWQRLWDRCCISCAGPEVDIQRILNLHIFHLLQTVSVYSIGLDVGVPPRGLHGEAYRGLIMWDELFIFPFLDLRIPDLTRTLLLYRYRRMRKARTAAREAGYTGVMFPWQSGSNGREEAQVLHLNPESGRWIPDNSQLQRHINIAVAYNVWKHYAVTGDRDFLSFYGAEMIVEIARFWAGIAQYDGSRERYVINRVMGPDEFHDGYPDREEPGLDNNAYTNVMVAWIMRRALDVLELLPPDRERSIRENLSLSQKETEIWRHMSMRMFVPFHDDGIISQFEGYDELEEFDWEAHRDEYGDIHRLDRILEAEGDSPNRYKVSKQADALMLFYLLSAEELSEIFGRLGYDLRQDMINRNVEYYLNRTSHGSTLSRIVHSWVLARNLRDQSWNLFQEALRSDVADLQGGTTHEGIHLGAMAGTVDLIQRCYTGLEIRGGVLRFNPHLPKELDEISFSIRYRSHWLNLRINHRELTIGSRKHDVPPIKVGVPGDTRELKPGEAISFQLENRYSETG